MAESARHKRVRYFLEGVGATLLWSVFRALPLPAASATGGFIARQIGPRMGVTRRAERNLRRAMPELSEPEITRIIRGMWDNLGRVVAEYPHLGKFKVYEPGGYIEQAGTLPWIKDHPPDPGEPHIFVSGHFGNWEIAAMAATQLGLKAVQIYRPPNNPTVARLIGRARSAVGGELLAKGTAGRRAVAALRKGAVICMLIDQKMNTGMRVPFFGRDAMTEKVIARLALRYDCRVIPARVERVKGVHFRFVTEEPVELTHSGDEEADVRALLIRLNQRLENWIRTRPDQWLWLHRRWID
ncbi:MAG: lysophospholipid acyltransferase family protein [Stellaceae bacterium]